LAQIKRNGAVKLHKILPINDGPLGSKDTRFMLEVSQTACIALDVSRSREFPWKWERGRPFNGNGND